MHKTSMISKNKTENYRKYLEVQTSFFMYF